MFLSLTTVWVSVTPHAGVWIEITVTLTSRGGWPVTPHAGVWIEMSPDTVKWFWLGVTPHAGVWIEISS